MEKKIVRTLEELDGILKELDEALAISDDELRRCFKTFEMEFPFELPIDPYCDEYRKKQFELYEFLANKPYSTDNEVSVFDVKNAVSRPWPYYTDSAVTIGEHMIAIGHVIRSMNLPKNQNILEFGFGWGNLTTALARSGHHVTAIDIEDRFVELVSIRAKQNRLDIEAFKEDFQFVHKTDRQWDAVVFFECFHHCADHHALIKGLDKIVAPNGKIIFAAEPILDEFPMPWGLRLDGESLWAIRNFGWCELGFQETYFRQLMEKHGWLLNKHVCSDTPWGTVFIATRQDELQK